MSVASMNGLGSRIKALARERNAVILAHNYERPEVQDVADFVGDSLGLSREAAKTSADVIVFCGVHFMAETAAILSPKKTVLLPDMAAGCSLADTITADQLRAWKAEHPGAVVVSYVNTTAAVKAESDYCCTSGNAVEIVNSIPADQEILFLHDFFLGAHVRRVTGRGVSRSRRHYAAQPEHATRRTPGRRIAGPPGMWMRDECGRGNVGRGDFVRRGPGPFDRRHDPPTIRVRKQGIHRRDRNRHPVPAPPRES
jgi:hypothetical protein